MPGERRRTGSISWALLSIWGQLDRSSTGARRDFAGPSSVKNRVRQIGSHPGPLGYGAVGITQPSPALRVEVPGVSSLVEERPRSRRGELHTGQAKRILSEAHLQAASNKG